MKIARVKISNILGITELEIEAGKFVEISGQNGKGKTSVLEAIKSVVRGGEDATLLRNGADKGEVVLVLDDGTEIRKRVTGRTQTTTVERDGKKVARPAEVIRELTDMLSVNPIDFLRTPAKKRVDVLLDSLPIAADPERLRKITGAPVALPANVPALAQVDSVRQSIYDARTGTNRMVKEKEATISQLGATLPVAVPAADEAVPSTGDLVEQIASIDGAKDAEMTRIETKLTGLRTEHNQKLAELRKKKEDGQEGFRRAAAAEAADYDARMAAETETFAEIERKAGTQRTKKNEEFAAKRLGLATQLATIEAQAGEITRTRQTRENIKTMEADALALREESQRQTAILADLDAYKVELLAALPIDGLEVRDGEIFRHGVPFDRLNTAQQVEIAVEIAKLRAGELGVICVDGIELLDGPHYEAFRKQAVSSGLQLFVTRVTDDEFNVKSEN